MRQIRAILKEIISMIQDHFSQQTSLSFKDWEIGLDLSSLTLRQRTGGARLLEGV